MPVALIIPLMPNTCTQTHAPYLCISACFRGASSLQSEAQAPGVAAFITLRYVCLWQHRTRTTHLAVFMTTPQDGATRREIQAASETTHKHIRRRRRDESLKTGFRDVMKMCAPSA